MNELYIQVLVYRHRYRKLLVFVDLYAAKKAMKTLDIGKGDDVVELDNIDESTTTTEPNYFVPTIMNVFRSIMKEANRENEVSTEID